MGCCRGKGCPIIEAAQEGNWAAIIFCLMCFGGIFYLAYQVIFRGLFSF